MSRREAEHPWEEYLNEVMTAEDAESESWERTYELLCELEQHPLNVNHVAREQLEQLPFLSAQQIEELMEYLYRYGPMKSLGELRMIRSLDDSQRRLLTYIIYIDESELAETKRHLSSSPIVWAMAQVVLVHRFLRLQHSASSASGRPMATVLRNCHALSAYGEA